MNTYLVLILLSNTVFHINLSDTLISRPYVRSLLSHRTQPQLRIYIRTNDDTYFIKLPPSSNISRLYEICERRQILKHGETLSLKGHPLMRSEETLLDIGIYTGTTLQVVTTINYLQALFDIFIDDPSLQRRLFFPYASGQQMSQEEICGITAFHWIQCNEKSEIIQLNFNGPIYGRYIVEINTLPLVHFVSLQYLKLSNHHIVNIDLSPLSQLTALRGLYLSDNQLQYLDLMPLSSLKSLEHIDFNGNQLEILNLEPIAGCMSLHKLYLNDNKLKSLDVRPLAECALLSGLYLSNNQLQYLELEPLKRCIKLNALDLSGNPFIRLDLTSLARVKSLELLDLSFIPIEKLYIPTFAGHNNLKILTSHD